MDRPIYCCRCELSDAEAAVVAIMRITEKTSKGGVTVRAHWNGAAWEIETKGKQVVAA